MSLNIQSPEDIQRAIANRAKATRLAHNLTRRTLAEKSGVSVSSIKRFETTGEISLNSLLNLAFALGRDKEFSELFNPGPPESIDELHAPPRQRGRR